MAVTLPTFTPLEDSLFLTLYARALDHRRPHPILGDAMSDQVVRTTNYDFDQLHVDTNLILHLALGAKKLDQVASAFLARRLSWRRALEESSDADRDHFRQPSWRTRSPLMGGGDSGGGDGSDSGGGSSQGQVVAGSNRAEAVVSDRGRERDHQEHQPRSTHQSHVDRGRGMGGTRVKEATAAAVPLRPARRALGLREISLRTQGRR